MQTPTCLTIAGSDSGGGAGIQADLKAFMALKVHGSSCITAITAQNTVGVQDIFPLPTQIIKSQIESVISDIGADAVKIGMLFNSEIIHAVADSLEALNLKKVILDPVMVATAQSRPLLSPDAIDTFKSRLLPLALILTPNVPEAEVLTGLKIENSDGMRAAAIDLHKLGARNVLIKGGHLPFKASGCESENEMEVLDLFFDGKAFVEFTNPFISTKNSHGTGCTLAAAIAAGIARGLEGIFGTFSSITVLEIQAVKGGIHYVRAAMTFSFPLGKGHGPVNHFLHIPDMEFQCVDSIVGYLVESTKALWAKFQNHPFVLKVENGSLPLSSFQYFLKQDYIFLRQFARFSSLSTFKAKDMYGITNGYNTTGALLQETEFHRNNSHLWSLTHADFEKASPGQATNAYIGYILDLTLTDEKLNIDVAMLPCIVGYAQMGRRFRQATRIPDNPYQVWIDYYGSVSYQSSSQSVEAPSKFLMPTVVSDGSHFYGISAIRNRVLEWFA
ncbi:hypothetical protein HDU97_009811 [Phlyctochytrium planicorne]|nr:hypothetical protein HDU97_009811 [Phlyctochytrium planicorne]